MATLVKLYLQYLKIQCPQDPKKNQLNGCLCFENFILVLDGFPESRYCNVIRNFLERGQVIYIHNHMITTVFFDLKFPPKFSMHQAQYLPTKPGDPLPGSCLKLSHNDNLFVSIHIKIEILDARD